MFITDLRAIHGDIHQLKGDEKVINAIEPDYTQFIPLNILRRMGKAVRMGMGVILPFKDITEIDAIIVGTANGGMEDCIKFLNQIVTYEEGVLTPTNFVQSTPNALAGQLAIMTKNHAYNATHTNNALSFENALIDAQLQFETSKAQQILVVGLDEISSYNLSIDNQMGVYRDDIINTQFIQNPSMGSIGGEGAASFLIRKVRSHANDLEILKVTTALNLNENELLDWFSYHLNDINLSATSIDYLFIGNNGDIAYESLYHSVAGFFVSAEKVYFKEKIGDFRTVSALGLYQIKQIADSHASNKKFLLYNTFHDRHSLMICQTIK